MSLDNPWKQSGLDPAQRAWALIPMITDTRLSFSGQGDVAAAIAEAIEAAVADLHRQPIETAPQNGPVPEITLAPLNMKDGRIPCPQCRSNQTSVLDKHPSVLSFQWVCDGCGAAFAVGSRLSDAISDELANLLEQVKELTRKGEGLCIAYGEELTSLPTKDNLRAEITLIKAERDIWKQMYCREVQQSSSKIATVERELEKLRR